MCECGCTSNDKRYVFSGPGESFYILVLSGGCTDCDAGPGISIQRADPGTHLFEFCGDNRDDYLDGVLVFEDWPDAPTAAVITGMQQHEFIKALMPHIVGIDSNEMGEDGTVDDDGADVILEEAYPDSMFEPKLVTNVGKIKKRGSLIPK